MMKGMLLAIAVLISTSLFAQKPVWGIKGGLNLATIKSSNENAQLQTNTRLGYHLAVISHNHLTHKIAIQPELQLSSQGAEVNTPSEDYPWRLSYINVPVMFQYMFNNGFRIEAGPYAGVLIGAKAFYDEGTNEDIKDNFKTLDAGLGFGLNYLTYTGFGFGGRYNIGLTNISDIGSKVQNQVFQISAFYMFDHDHKRKSR